MLHVGNKHAVGCLIYSSGTGVCKLNSVLFHHITIKVSVMKFRKSRYAIHKHVRYAIHKHVKNRITWYDLVVCHFKTYGNSPRILFLTVAREILNGN